MGPAGQCRARLTSRRGSFMTFVSTPWTLCTRDVLAEALYGPYRPNSDRAVDVIVTRLRKKIASLGQPSVQYLIKTEFRRGYMFVADVSFGAPVKPRPMDLPLHARSA